MPERSPPRGTKGRKHSTHQHPCSGAVACRETLRGGLGGLSLRGVMGSGEHEGALERVHIRDIVPLPVILRLSRVELEGFLLNRLRIAKRRGAHLRQGSTCIRRGHALGEYHDNTIML